MTRTYDCVIVGARCAGATLARFLAQAGKRVLVVDAATFPSDQPLSTHFIHPYGMRILDELGLGERVRAIAPPVSVFWNGCEGHVAKIVFPEGGSCMRRYDLDALLVDGAREAGAEVELGGRVVDVVRRGDRVTGVVIERDGRRESVAAEIVVGADGRSSTVAELVGADEYYAYDGDRSAYWAYWPRPSWYTADPRYQGGAIIQYTGRDMRFVFPTNRDQLLIGNTFPRAEVAAWKADPAGKLRAVLEAHSATKPLVEGVEPIGKVIGVVKLRYFFRRAAGPGWALVGDAGLHKDPTPGFGISDALRDARALATAIGDGGDAALERYWRQRDVDSIELFHFARDQGRLDFNNPLNHVVFAKLAAREELRARIVEVIERRRSPFEAFTIGEIVRWTLGAVVRGKLGVVKPFFAAGKYGNMVKREVRLRRDLLVPALPDQVAKAA